MADIKYLAPIILKWEGNFVNHPNDKGGPTNKGVTIATYEAYCRKKGYPKPTVERLKNLTQEQWIDILKTMYWDRWKADQINNQAVANILVDWTWGSGAWGIKFPQRILGVKDDGIVGPKTIAALNDYPDQSELFKKIWMRRKQHFEDIVKADPTQKVFLKGWLNRLNDFKYVK